MSNKFITKFRAFQLDSEGSLFSYYKEHTYTLIEARLPKGGINVLAADLELHGLNRINTLHITSWDLDHCNYDDLVAILNNFRPDWIEVPSYEPDTDQGRLCKKVIFRYDDIHQRFVNNVRVIDAAYLRTLEPATSWTFNDVAYPSMFYAPNKNDRSLIRFFRSPGFNVLSLGDAESEEIAKYLSGQYLLTKEVDVLILPHHGSDNSCLTSGLVDALKPKLTVCSSNYDNKFEHPSPSVCNLLGSRGIKSMTTKRGDVFVYQMEGDTSAKAVNFIANNTDSEKPFLFVPKRNSRTATL